MSGSVTRAEDQALITDIVASGMEELGVEQVSPTYGGEDASWTGYTTRGVDPNRLDELAGKIVASHTRKFDGMDPMVFAVIYPDLIAVLNPYNPLTFVPE